MNCQQEMVCALACSVSVASGVCQAGEIMERPRGATAWLGSKRHLVQVQCAVAVLVKVSQHAFYLLFAHLISGDSCQDQLELLAIKFAVRAANTIEINLSEFEAAQVPDTLSPCRDRSGEGV